MIYGYARVSTVNQAKDGNSLEAQEQLLKAFGAEKIYVDAYTGTKAERPEFSKLLQELKASDTLVVTKVDRLTRSLIQGLEIVKELKDRGVTINILNFGVINNTPNGILMLQMFMAFAEFERNNIVERTQEGKRIARTKPDFKDGRPAREIENLEQVHQDIKCKKITLEQGLAILGIPRSTYFYRVRNLAPTRAH